MVNKKHMKRNNIISKIWIVYHNLYLNAISVSSLMKASFDCERMRAMRCQKYTTNIHLGGNNICKEVTKSVV